MSEVFGSGFEGLEDRTLLAAAVTTALFNPVTGVLVLNGDGGSNEISVYNDGDGVPGHVTVDVNGEKLKIGNTTVSGGVFEFTGVTNIIVNSGAGNDTVNIYDVDLPGGVLVNAGAGIDNVLIGAAGYQPDSLVPFAAISGDTSFGGSVILNGDAGNDYLEIYAGGGSEVSIGGLASLNGGFGNDTLEVGTGAPVAGSDISITLSLLMDGGAGNDFLGIENYEEEVVPTGTSLVPYVLNSSSITVGSLFVRGGIGNDDFDIEGLTVLGNAVVWGDSGNDRFCLENNTVSGVLAIDGWLGNDTAHLSGNTAQGGTLTANIETFLNYCPLNVG